MDLISYIHTCTFINKSLYKIFFCISYFLHSNKLISEISEFQRDKVIRLHFQHMELYLFAEKSVKSLLTSAKYVLRFNFIMRRFSISGWYISPLSIKYSNYPIFLENISQACVFATRLEIRNHST